MTGRRVAITGARGRLASGLIHAVEREGAGVVRFSRRADTDHRPLETLGDRDVLREFDAILHLGWSTVPLVSEQDPGREQREDLVFLRRLAAAVSALSDPPQLVFFSTAAVYGNTPMRPATEETDCAPLGRYAAAKWEAEKLLEKVPRACRLRITNVFGSLSTEKPQGIIPLLYRACHGGTPVTIWGDGSATKDYLHEDDLGAAVVAVLRARLSGVFNVASGHSLSLHEIIDLVETASRKRLAREHAAHYPWDVTRSMVSSARLTAATGWRAAHHPADSIRQMMAD